MAELKLEDLKKKLILLRLQNRTPEIIKQMREIKKMIARENMRKQNNG